jgi:hypothetical protein
VLYLDNRKTGEFILYIFFLSYHVGGALHLEFICMRERSYRRALLLGLYLLAHRLEVSLHAVDINRDAVDQRVTTSSVSRALARTRQERYCEAGWS